MERGVMECECGGVIGIGGEKKEGGEGEGRRRREEMGREERGRRWSFHRKRKKKRD